MWQNPFAHAKKQLQLVCFQQFTVLGFFFLACTKCSPPFITNTGTFYLAARLPPSMSNVATKSNKRWAELEEVLVDAVMKQSGH